MQKLVPWAISAFAITAIFLGIHSLTLGETMLTIASIPAEEPPAIVSPTSTLAVSFEASTTPPTEFDNSDSAIRFNQFKDRDRLLAMLDEHDPSSIFAVVDAIQADPELSRNCHELAHVIGWRAYQYYGFLNAIGFNNPKHVQRALVENICAGGYMHGVLEALLVNEPDFLEHPNLACASLSDVDAASCFHGVGHAFMAAFAGDAEASILGCRLLELHADRYRCFEGVRMEQFWGTPAHASTTLLEKAAHDPLSICRAAPLDEKPTCLLYAPFGYLRVHPKEYQGAVLFCTQSGLSELESGFCLKGLGITMMSKFKGRNLEGSETYVTNLPVGEKRSFYEGVLGYAHLSGISADELSDTCVLFKNDAQLCASILLGVH